MLKNSSEILEAVQLFHRLQGTTNPLPKVIEPSNETSFAIKEPEMSKPKSAAVLKKVLNNPPPIPFQDIEEVHFTDDKLGNILMRMCMRGDFAYGVIFDDNGFVVANYGNQYDESVISAIAAVLGATQEKIVKMIEGDIHGSISLDLNLLDKIVLTRFEIGSAGFYIIVVCPQDRDVSEELELTISEIKNVLDQN
jgi:hypothetical protein